MITAPPNKKWPEIKAALAGWLKSHEEERKEGAIDAIDTDAVEPSAVVVPRPYKHTHSTLDVEIATALWAGDVDPNAPQPSVTRWANGIIKEDREDFKRWSIQLRTQANILKYDRPTIFGVVRNVPATDAYRFPESHKRYITEYLKAHGKMENEDDETEQNTAASTGPLESESPETSTVATQHSDDVSATGTVETAPPVERTGPFYYRTADGQPGRANKLAKLEAVIEQGCIEITKEEYQALKEAPPVQQQASSDHPGINNLGNGRFSIEGLAPEQPQTDENSASNEVEKTEVAPQAAPDSDAFVLRADELEKELGDSENLSLWKALCAPTLVTRRIWATSGSVALPLMPNTCLCEPPNLLALLAPVGDGRSSKTKWLKAHHSQKKSLRVPSLLGNAFFVMPTAPCFSS